MCVFLGNTFKGKKHKFSQENTFEVIFPAKRGDAGFNFRRPPRGGSEGVGWSGARAPFRVLRGGYDGKGQKSQRVRR